MGLTKLFDLPPPGPRRYTLLCWLTTLIGLISAFNPEQHEIDPLGFQSGYSDDLLIKTSLLTIQGAISESRSNVRQFLGIPFAEPPIGPLRFRPPVTKKATEEVIDATKFGPYCYQHDTGAPSLYSELPGNGFMPGQIESEDCLTLDIWAPRSVGFSGQTENLTKPIGEKGAAVMIWIHGGALMGGDSSAPYMHGTNLVSDDEDIIVVSVNYRVSIFGFPRSDALDGRNLNPGFMDVRMGVEWVYQNIAHFGGDPNQMILFGNSAGSTQVDKYIYNWAHDPLVKGYIMMSGQGELSADPNDNSNFTYVANKIGCSMVDKDDLFKCMQESDAQKIMEVLNTYSIEANGGKVLNFQPQADNQTSFSNYTDLQVRGLYSHLPQIIGNCDNEFASLYKPYTGEAPDQALLDTLSDGMFICAAAKAANARQQSNVPVWRYRYFGDFPNQSFLPWLRAYHGSDVPMAFGTSHIGSQNTPEQEAISKYLRDVFVSFAKDPDRALVDKFGWPTYQHHAETLVRIGYQNSIKPDFVLGSMYDSACEKLNEKDPQSLLSEL